MAVSHYANCGSIFFTKFITFTPDSHANNALKRHVCVIYTHASKLAHNTRTHEFKNSVVDLSSLPYSGVEVSNLEKNIYEL